MVDTKSISERKSGSCRPVSYCLISLPDLSMSHGRANPGLIQHCGVLLLVNTLYAANRASAKALESEQQFRI
jgi:hypothetical protein